MASIKEQKEALRKSLQEQTETTSISRPRLSILFIQEDMKDVSSLVNFLEAPDDSRKSCPAFSVDIANNVQDALRLFTDNSYSLIILDCHFQETPANDLIKNFLELVPDQPFLTMAKKGHEQLALKPVPLGIGDYVIKDSKGNYFNYINLLIDNLLLRFRQKEKQHEQDKITRHREGNYKTLIATSPVCIHELSLEGKFISMNPAGLRMMHVKSEDEVCGLIYTELPIREDQERIIKLFEDAKLGKSSRFEFQAEGKEGTLHYSSSFDPIYDENGKIIKIMGMTEDVTKKKRAELALREAKDFLESRVEERTTELSRKIQAHEKLQKIHNEKTRLLELTLNNIDQGFVFWDQDQNMVTCNQKFLDLYEVDAEFFIPGTNILDLLRYQAENGHYGDGNIEEQVEKRTKELSLDYKKREHRHITRLGRELLIRRLPIEGYGRIATFTDITDVVEQEQAAQLLQEAIETFSDSIIVYNEHEEVVYTNHRYHEIYPHAPPKDKITGCLMADMLRTSLEAGQIDHPLAKTDPEAWLAMRLKERREPRDIEGMTKHTSGQSFFYKRHLSSSGGHIHIQTDITEQLEAKEELETSREQLQKQISEMQDKEIRLEAQAADLVTLAENLSEANQEKERLNEQKDKFFSIIAHDLKGPFNALLGFSSLLSEENSQLNSDQTQEYGQLVHKSAQQVFKLLENLLEWSLLQMGRMDYEPGPVELEEVININEILFAAAANKKSINLISKCEDYTVLADYHMTDTILRNLINNAIKFTPEGGSVSIHAKRNGDFVELEVTDTGVGISPDLAERLFRLGENTTTVGTDGEKGTGLGLHLCKDLVEYQGGQIQILSSEGSGATFRITLPVYKAEILSEHRDRRA